MSQDEADPNLFARPETLSADEGVEPNDADAQEARASYVDPEFEAFFGSLGLVHFTASEFLVMGSGHKAGNCGGLNTIPPQYFWPNIVWTARVLDHLRGNLGYPLRLTSVYRSPAYNSCIGGASRSYHLYFNAVDFQASSADSRTWANALLDIRTQGYFHGGIGLYDTFVHVDTRGTNVTWGF